MTLFMQNALHMPPLRAGSIFVPLALAFVVASRHSGVRSRHRGSLVLIEGCVVQVIGLAALAATVLAVNASSALLLAVPLAVFGYGQGLVMAPLSSAVLSTVQTSSAGAGSGMYGTTTQIANAVGVAAIGAVYFAVQSEASAVIALLASFALCVLSVAACAGFLLWMRRAGAA
jgi:predicted MFS family arabinose efflux permease